MPGCTNAKIIGCRKQISRHTMLLGCSDAEIQRIWDTVYLKAKYIECENAKIPGCMMHINISLQVYRCRQSIAQIWKD